MRNFAHRSRIPRGVGRPGAGFREDGKGADAGRAGPMTGDAWGYSTATGGTDGLGGGPDRDRQGAWSHR